MEAQLFYIVAAVGRGGEMHRVRTACVTSRIGLYRIGGNYCLHYVSNSIP